MCTNNRLILGAVAALRVAERRSELFGFDVPEYASVLPVSVTLVAQDPGRLGRLAAERLFARLEGDTSPATTYRLPTDLVVRGGAW
ncbi:substrate-binding domain-containing protein [Tessaracoccus sp. HDW20]|nr:substrate-binding domain-containing protein [Tessaracoccus coleopterorum]